MKTLYRPILALAAAAVLPGCGGGASSSRALALTDANRSAVATNVVNEAQQISQMVGVSALSRSVRVQHANLLTFTGLAVRASRSGSSRDLALSALGLYYSSTTTSSGFVLNFYSDPSGTQPAGAITVTTVTPVGAFPETLRMSGTLPTIPATLSLTLTINDSSGTSASVQGSMSAAGTRLSNINLALTNLDANSISGTLTGSMTISDSAGTATFTSINANISDGSGMLSCNFSASGFSGTATINADGSGTMTIRDSGGTSQVTWSSSMQGTITYPDGTQAAITV